MFRQFRNLPSMQLCGVTSFNDYYYIRQRAPRTYDFLLLMVHLALLILNVNSMVRRNILFNSTIAVLAFQTLK
jgi:hypothetical protein